MSELTRSVKSQNGIGKFVKTYWFILFVLASLFSYALDPVFDTNNKNKKIKSDFWGDFMIIPEMYGYLGGVFNYDTLEFHSKNIVIHKHSFLNNEMASIPSHQVKKIIFGTFLSLKYIKVEYDDGIFGGSYRIFINSDPYLEIARSYWDPSKTMIEYNWK